MRNRYMTKFDSIIKVSIKGNNIDNYIRRIIKKRVNIIKLVPISHKEVHLIINYNDYKKLVKYKSIYTISIIGNYGNLRIKNIFKKNMVLFVCFGVGLVLLLFLSRMIFSIDVVIGNKEIRGLLLRELDNNGIHRFGLKKSYSELEKIEDNILNNNKDKFEWIEIIESGTKYTVRVEERKLNNAKSDYQDQSIVARKRAIITEIIAESGEKVKGVNDYVKKGDVIISGFITLPNNEMVKSMALGRVYGEVWYKVSMSYPLVYHEEKLTGRIRRAYVINFLGKRISLFPFEDYKTFKIKNKVFVNNLLGNFSFALEKQYELKIIDEVNHYDDVVNKAKEYLSSKMMKDNKKIKEIKNIYIISSRQVGKGVELELFVSAIEDIGELLKIENESVGEAPK